MNGGLDEFGRQVMERFTRGELFFHVKSRTIRYSSQIRKLRRSHLLDLTLLAIAMFPMLEYARRTYLQPDIVITPEQVEQARAQTSPSAVSPASA